MRRSGQAPVTIVIVNMDEIICEGYDLELVPKTAIQENKTGVTIRGSESRYLEAHRMLKDMLSKKGDRFVINGVEIDYLIFRKTNQL